MPLITHSQSVKSVFWGIKHSTSVWVLTQKTNFFAQFYSKFATFLCFFSFLAQKTLKMTIYNSIWGAQHPNTGQNIQQILILEKIICTSKVECTVLFQQLDT